jgi:cytochrome b561
MDETHTSLTPPRRQGWLNSTTHFGWASQAFHWAVALLVFTVIGLGWTATSYAREDPLHEAWMVVHKSVGLSALLLTLLRLSWILRSPPPPLAPALKPWERKAARWVHRLLYAALIAMPLSGMLLSQAVDKPIGFFGLFELPQLIKVDPAIPPEKSLPVIAGAVMHKFVFIWLLYGLLAFHVAGIAKHLVLDRDPGALRRMLGR